MSNYFKYFLKKSSWSAEVREKYDREAVLASSSCLYNKEWGEKRKRNRRGIAGWKGSAVSNGPTATLRGDRASLQATPETGTLHLLLKWCHRRKCCKVLFVTVIWELGLLFQHHGQRDQNTEGTELPLDLLWTCFQHSYLLSFFCLTYNHQCSI